MNQMRITFGALIIVLSVNLAVQGQEDKPVYSDPYSPHAGEVQTQKSWKQHWHEFWYGVELHRARVNAWPEPFTQPDRELVRTPLRMMADKGWREQNTFADYFFNEAENDLNYAGQQKLRWIITQIPPHRRQIFVVEANATEQTSMRVASVFHYMSEIAPGEDPYPVYTTKIPPRGGDGSYINNIDRQFRTSAPEPRLPTAVYSTTFSGTGSGSP